MKLIFLHGSPTTGKLTIARALLGLMPGRLFDDHAAIDLARTLLTKARRCGREADNTI